MKPIIFTLCLLFVLAISVKAEEFYTCIDSDGNSVITDSPHDGMKNCVLKNSYTEKSPKVKEAQEGGATVKKDNDSEKVTEKRETNSKRINNCINCCNNKVQACYNYTGDSRLCSAEIQNCVATCNSEGSSPSSWSDCWSNSENN